MPTRLRFRLLALGCLAAGPVAAQATNPLNLFVADVGWRDGRPIIGTPRKLTHDEGSNSQPSFTPDGKAILFSGLRGGGGAGSGDADARSDIYRIDLASGKETRVSWTPENENSPTMNAAGEYVAVRWVPATLFKEYGIWSYGPDGVPRRGVLPGPDTTGYFRPLDHGDYALMRPKHTFTVALFSAKTGSIVDVDSLVATLPPQRIPGERAVSYTRTDSSGRNEIRRVDLDTRKVSSVAPTLVGRTVHVWLPGHRMLLMAKGNTIFARRPGRDAGWTAVASFDSPELRNLAAYAVSPQGDKLVLTSPLKPALTAALRDSLEVGRSMAEVVAAFGNAKDYFMTPGVIALADDRRLVHPGADEVLFVEFVRTLFPDSHRVWARLGDAYGEVRDPVRAREAYKKALELNPRATPADRAAAERVEKAIKDLGG